MKIGKTGVSSSTPKNIIFGAGTIHVGLKYSATPLYVKTKDTYIHPGKTYYTRSGTEPNYTYSSVPSPSANTLSQYYEDEGHWNGSETCIGATQGGSKLSIVPEIKRIEADGAMVAVQGLDVKTGEKATMEINMLELSAEMIKSSVVGTSSSNTEYDIIESKPLLEVGDYYENIAFVGKNLEGKNIVVILDNALCTSGFESEGKHKEAGVGKFTFECYADIESDLDSLPYHIYYPKATT